MLGVGSSLKLSIRTLLEEDEMNTEEFNVIVATIHEECIHVLTTKGKDYTPDESDRLSQFKEIAIEVGITPRQVIGVLLIKHYQSICKVIRGETLLAEQLESKVIDEINYLCFLLAQVEEETKGKKEKKIWFKGVEESLGEQEESNDL